MVGKIMEVKVYEVTAGWIYQRRGQDVRKGMCIRQKVI